jgi:ParB family chromosome partitioning protein
LGRAELTTLQRSEQIAEYAALAKEAQDELSRQSAAKPHNGRPEGGTRQAARDLGLDEKDVRRAEKVAGLTDEAKQAAVETGEEAALGTNLLQCLQQNGELSNWKQQFGGG